MPIDMMIRKLRLHSDLSEEDTAALRSIVSHVRELPAETCIQREGDVVTRNKLAQPGQHGGVEDLDVVRRLGALDERQDVLQIHVAQARLPAHGGHLPGACDHGRPADPR